MPHSSSCAAAVATTGPCDFEFRIFRNLNLDMIQADGLQVCKGGCVGETCHGFLIILFGFGSACSSVCSFAQCVGGFCNAQLIDSQNSTCHTSNSSDLLSPDNGQISNGEFPAKLQNFTFCLAGRLLQLVIIIRYGSPLDIPIPNLKVRVFFKDFPTFNS